jgi:hypothetical protein
MSNFISFRVRALKYDIFGRVQSSSVDEMDVAEEDRDVDVFPAFLCPKVDNRDSEASKIGEGSCETSVLESSLWHSDCTASASS